MLLLEIQSDSSNCGTVILFVNLSHLFLNLARQVTDFLRTRLTSQGAELAEARHRVTELERLPFGDKEEQKQTMRSLAIARALLCSLQVSCVTLAQSNISLNYLGL
jgi:hypothetical protein